MKKILATILLSCMVLSLCACGSGKGNTENNSQNTESQAKDSQTSEDTEDDGKVVYKVTVTDEAGNPLSGVMVQICKDTCMPAKTNEQGVAEFEVADEEGYKISFPVMPEGYELTTEETEFYYEDGATEMTLTLKAVQ